MSFSDACLMSRTVWCLVLCLAGCAQSPVHPNVILILADDMGYGDPGAYNAESRIPTVYMDRLANEGIRFTNAHSPSAVCTPTRYALLTGRYAFRLPELASGVTNGYSPLIADTAITTVADVLGAAGYHTAAIGKWHLGLGTEEPVNYANPLTPGPRAMGFDYFYGIPASLDMAPYVWVENESVTAAPTLHAENPVGCCTGAFWRSGAIAPNFDHTDVLPDLTTRSVEYIRTRSRSRTPFFLYLALAAPHTPWLPTEEYLSSSRAGEYGDFTVQVDATLGAIMEILDETGEADNTILIMTSDNGAYWPDPFKERFEHLANHRWRGMKADIHEGGHRVPFIVRWPDRTPAGGVTDQLTVHTDFLATFADLVGAADRTSDSFSFLSVLTGHPPGHLRQEAVHQSINGMLAIRRGSWKLIDGKGSGGFTRADTSEADPPRQLYNLSTDPAEQNNLYAIEPDTAAALLAALDSLRVLSP